MRIATSIIALVALQALPAMAATSVIKSKLYELGKVEGEPLFTQQTTLEDQKDGTQKGTSWIKDAEGNTVMTEEVILKGTEVISQKDEQRQTKESYELVREGKDLIFRTFDLGETPPKLKEENKQERPENFITGPATNAFLLKNWDALKNGKTVEAQFGVFEVSKSVGFDFSWQATKDGLATIRMKPSSTLISFFVSSIFIYMTEDGSKMMRFKGRTPLKRKVNGNLKPFDAEILYEYDAPKAK